MKQKRFTNYHKNYGMDMFGISIPITSWVYIKCYDDPLKNQGNENWNSYFRIDFLERFNFFWIELSWMLLPRGIRFIPYCDQVESADHAVLIFFWSFHQKCISNGFINYHNKVLEAFLWR